MDFPSPSPSSQPGGFAPVPPQPTPSPLPPQPQPMAQQPMSPMPPQPQPVQIPVQSHPGAMGADDQVYTMPDKFIPANQPAAVSAKRPKKWLTILLIVIIVLAVLGIIGGVVFYVLRVMNTEPVVTDAQNAVVVNTNNTNNANTVANINDNENVNKNENINDNENSNDNENLNDNTNDNSNENVNENVNDNANVNANVNTNANTNVTTTTVPEPGKDTDEDSLTNDEEKIWGTKADLPDTDSDGYTDGIEILAGYDPTNATSAGRLADNTTLTSTFANDDYNYSILYPAGWLAEALDEGDTSEITLTPNTLDLTGQFIAITAVENPTGLTAVDWYVETANVDEAELETFTTFAGATGVWSTDGTTGYLANSDYVYAVSYRYGNATELYFPSSFEMVAKSVILTEAKKRTNNNANEATD